MSITPTASRNYAESILDGRTTYSRNQQPRSLDIAQTMHDINLRPEPIYSVGDSIRLEDGTLRRITFRTYSQSQKTYLYRLETTQRNRFNGIVSTGNIPECEVIDMDKSDSLPAAADSHKIFDGWIVQFKSGRESSEYRVWTNSDGGVALFERDIAIQFAQGMVMVYDSVKQWATFRVRPYEGYKGERHFFTLIQPDGKYTAAISAFAEIKTDESANICIGFAGFNDDDFPIKYYDLDSGFLFLRRAIDNWRIEYNHDGRIGYSNPNRPQFNIGDLMKLPTKFMRPVQFITPYWIKPGHIGFRYWFYVRDKQLVRYTQDQLEAIYDVETVELEIEYTAPRLNLVKVAQRELAEQPEPEPDIQCVLAKLQAEIESLQSQNEALEKSLRIANKKVELIQAKEVQYHLENKNKFILASTLRKHAPDAWNEVKTQLHETIEYDKVVSPIMVENNEAIRKINRLKDVLCDIEKACRNLSVDLNDDYSWIGFMASMGLNGGYYSDELKARFGLIPKPNHTMTVHPDEL